MFYNLIFPGSPAVAGQLASRYNQFMNYVYVVYNKMHDKIYVGQTNNVDRRLIEHNSQRLNKKQHTSKFSGQWMLIYEEEFDNRSLAIAREKELKSHQGREFLKQYIPG